MRIGYRSAALLAAAGWCIAWNGPSRADDLDEAKAQFLKSCGTCHSAERGAAPRQGPTLAGVIGRRAGTLEGYAYSPALKSWGEVWTEDLLDPWITNAQATRPGTVMNYRQADEAKRALIIRFLKSLGAS